MGLNLKFLAVKWPEKKPSAYWQDKANQIRFFRDLAKHLGYNPANPAEWKQITRSQVNERQVRVTKTRRILFSYVPIVPFLGETVVEIIYVCTARTQHPFPRNHSRYCSIQDNMFLLLTFFVSLTYYQ